MSKPLVAAGSLPHNSLFISDDCIYVIVGESDTCDPLVKLIAQLTIGYWMRIEDQHKIHKFDFFKVVSLIVPS